VIGEFRAHLTRRVNGHVKTSRNQFVRSLARATGLNVIMRDLVTAIASAQARSIAEEIARTYVQQCLSPIERRKIDEITAVDQELQILLSLRYRELLEQHRPLPTMADVQFRSYSQNGEDGILLYIFSLVGSSNNKAVEICAGNGMECNAANLIINHRWVGLLFDGNRDHVEWGLRLFDSMNETRWQKPRFVHAWITAENVNELVREHGFAGEIDLFSLDLDGIDYWIWKALDCIQPRVVVLEYNWIWGADRSVTIPYRADFVNTDPTGRKGGIGNRYFGASLPAFVKLGRQKGYRLIGCEGWGFNAFFMRDDVGQDVFPEIDAAECAAIPMQLAKRHPNILQNMDPSWEWVEV
jgi:hypothetical protein